LEAAAWHYAIKPVCRVCGHHAVFDPHGLWWLFERKGWDDRLTVAAGRFYCLACRRDRRAHVRRAALYLVKDEPTVRLPLPPESQWKRVVSRMRS
jgi:hypothetical protein